jgi:hypothetical protein
MQAIRRLTLLWVFIAVPLSAISEEKVLGEDTLKALYSYKFALFAEWPDAKQNTASANLEFCIIGRNPFGQAALDSILGKPVKAKNIHVEVFSNGVLSEESLNNCHVAFISSSEAHRLSAILDNLQRRPILSISEIPGFSSHGGMITLIKSGDHIQFEINPDAIQQAGLTMSSKIIELATLVKTTNEGQE